jgi:hypothetical protein
MGSDGRRLDVELQGFNPDSWFFVDSVYHSIGCPSFK